MKLGNDTKTITDLPYSYQEAQPGSDKDSPDNRLSRNLTVFFGLLAVLSAVVGLIGVRSGITVISTVYLGYKTIALSAALIWILTGLVLAVHAMRPLREIPAFVVKIVLAGIVIFEAIELPLNILGSHSPVEIWLTDAGRSILGPSSSAISPIASVLIILTSVSLFFLIRKTGRSGKKDQIPDAIGVTGTVVSLVGFTFVLSYVFGDPLLYGTQFIPITALSALAAFFAGAGLITAAGPAAVPLRYVTGNSTRALLLRIFVPLTVCIVIIQQILFSWISAGNLMHKAIAIAGSLVLFAVATGYVVSRVSGSLGSALDRSEKALVQKNTELHALNEELVAIEEELRQNIGELGKSGDALRKSERRLSRAQEIARLGSWELDIPNNRLSWSDEVYRIFGLAPQEFAATYDAFLAAVHPDDRAAVDAAYTGSIQEGRDSYEIEHRVIQKKTGEIRYVHEKCEHSRDSAGRIIRSVGMVHDITERWQAEEALRKAKEDLEIRVRERTAELGKSFELLQAERYRLYDVLETLPVYICLLDKDYRMPFANRYFREAFGEANGRRCYEALFNRTEPCEICETYTVLKTRAPHQWFWTGPNGRDYEVHDFPFTDADGTFMILEMGIDITERKRAEQEWAILASIVEHSDDAIIGKSLDGIIMSWNSGAGKIYGYSAEETIGRHISMLVSSGKKAHLEHILDLIRKGEPVIHYDTVRVRKDHREIEVSLTISPIKDRNGTVIGASTIARDISERKKYEKMIEKANAYNRSLIEASLDPLVTINPDGTISDVNEATIRVTGFSRAELVGTDFLDYFTEPAKAKAGYEKVFRDGTVTDYALEIRHRDGSVTPVLYNASVYRDTLGNVIGVFASARDITERKRTEEELRKAHDLLDRRVRERTSELVQTNTSLRVEIEERKKAESALRETSQYLENLINCANAPIIVWDPQFRITLFNHAFEHLTDWKAEDIIGKPLEILLPPNYQKEVMDLIRKTITGERWEIVEIPIRQKSGKVRTVLWNSAPIYDFEGKTIVSIIAQGQDITERKGMECENRVRTRELAKTNAQLKEEIVQRMQAEILVKKTISELQAAIESTADGIYAVDRTGRIIRYNQNFASMWKIPEDILESNENSRVSDYLRTQVKNPGLFPSGYAEHLNHRERETFDMLELTDGRIFERYSKPQKMDSAIIGRVLSYRDVTDRRHAEEKLIASLQEKETLIREIHHRVKNNLQIISGLLDMTRMRTQDSTTSGILTDMMMKIKTMAQIHTRLYESKQFDRINMGSQIRDQVTDLSSIYGRSGTEIETVIDAEDIFLPVDQAIPCALVVNEILSNAFKHAFKGAAYGTLQVSAIQKDGIIRIRIRDDGVGIPKDVDVYKTTSLGLKLIRSLVTQLRGTVTITGNTGTEVIVEFPIHPGGA